MLSALEVTESEISTSQPPNNSASHAANAFIVDRPKKKCATCKRVGHTYYDCWYNPKSEYYKENKKRWPKMVEQLKRMKLFKKNSNGEGPKFEDKGSTNECHYVFITGNENIRLKWFVDSCASRHLTNQRHCIKNFKPVKSDSANLAVQGSSVNFEGIGDTVEVMFRTSPFPFLD